MSATLLPQVEVIMWNLGGGMPPSINHVRSVLRNNGLDVTRAADIAPSTAFRRAAIEIRSAAIDGVITSRVFKKKHVVDHVETDTVAMQVNRDLGYNEEKEQLESEKAGVYVLDDSYRNDEYHVMPCTDDSDRIVLGQLRTAYIHALHHYQWGDLSTVLSTILKKDGMGIYSPRRAGGVYFCPLNSTLPDLMDRVEQFSIQSGIGLLRLGVPDTAVARQMVMDSITDSFLIELETHRLAIDEYGDETRSNIFSNRRIAIESTGSAIIQMEKLLGEQARALCVQLDEVTTLLEGKETSAANRPAPRRRQLVTS